MASSSAGQKSLNNTLGDGQHITVLVKRSHSLPTDDTISYVIKTHSNRPWEAYKETCTCNCTAQDLITTKLMAASLSKVLHGIGMAGSGRLQESQKPTAY